MDRNRIFTKYGPWAIITGASSGLGLEFAEQLAQLKLNVVLVARRIDRLKQLAERLEREYGIKTRVLVLDLAKPGAPDELLDHTQDLEVGLLINNAGFSNTGELIQSQVEKEQLLFRVNCEVPLHLSMELGKKMIERGRGGILFVSSSVAFSAVPYWTHYSAAKSFILHIGEGMYYELKSKGVDVLTVCPGAMKTEFQEVAGIRNIGALDVKPVAEKAIKHLGRKVSIVPGWHNAATFRFLPKILPSKIRLAMFGFLLSKLKLKSQ